MTGRGAAAPSVRDDVARAEESTVSTEQVREEHFKVVKNHEDQYSIWPADREPPRGWSEVGKSGPKEECLAFVDEVWTDMRPRSLRERSDGGR
jgi:MbtH protein